MLLQIDEAKDLLSTAAHKSRCTSERLTVSALKVWEQKISPKISSEISLELVGCQSLARHVHMRCSRNCLTFGDKILHLFKRTQLTLSFPFSQSFFLCFVHFSVFSCVFSFLSNHFAFRFLSIHFLRC